MADNASVPSAWGDLLSFCTTTFYRLAKNREKLLEPGWNRHREAFMGIMTGWWKATGDQSDTHIGVTRQKVVAGVALVMDQELQGGDIPFTLVPSPMENITLEDLPPEQAKSISEAIEDMSDVIKQQLTDCQADGVLSRNILSGALYGESIAKYYVHTLVTPGWQQVQPQGVPGIQAAPDAPWEQIETSRTGPGWGYVSVWKIFRDLEAEVIRKGAGVIERDMVSAHYLRGKKGKAFWRDDAIDRLISYATQPGDESSTPENQQQLQPALRDVPHRWKNLDFKECYLLAPRSAVEAFERQVLEEDKAKQTGVGSYIPPNVNDLFGYETENEAGDDIAVAVGYAGCSGHGTNNEEIVFYRRLPPEEWPYYRFVWQDQLDEVGGAGVADSVEQAQKMLNGSVRAFEYGKKMSSSPIIGVKERMLVDGKAPDTVTAGMVVRIGDDARNINDAMSVFTVPDVANGIVPLIDLAFRVSEEDSMIPRTAQGLSQSEKMTAYQVAQLVEKAGKYIGQVIRNVDNMLEEIITDFYNYNMRDPDLDVVKGNYMVKPMGFTTYQDRIVRVQNLMQFLGLLLNNPLLAAEYKMGEIAEDIGKALNIRVERFRKSPEDKQAEAEQAGAMTPEVAMQLQMVQANLGKIQAETQAILAKIQQDQEKIKLSQADMMLKMESAARPQPTTSAQVKPQGGPA